MLKPAKTKPSPETVKIRKNQHDESTDRNLPRPPTNADEIAPAETTDTQTNTNGRLQERWRCEVEATCLRTKTTTKTSDRRPAIVFFFGGGWVGGSPSQFYPHCEHLAKQGVVAMAAEYRVQKKHKTTPFECVKDGKSAIRYVRANAEKLGVDPKRVAAGGGSAGGHVAAATGTVPGLNEGGEDTSVSCIPNALVLFNPVYDNGPDGWGHRKVKDRYKEISPMHNISKVTPPAIVFLGTNDKLIPVATAEKFRDKMKAVGVQSELVLFKGRTHGFFNASKGDGSDYRACVKAMDNFLRKTNIIRKK